jgi:hypothetical protein
MSEIAGAGAGRHEAGLACLNADDVGKLRVIGHAAGIVVVSTLLEGASS